MNEKIIIGVISALLSGIGTYSLKTLSIEARLDGMERSLQRIESRLFPLDHMK